MLTVVHPLFGRDGRQLALANDAFGDTTDREIILCSFSLGLNVKVKTQVDGNVSAVHSCSFGLGLNCLSGPQLLLATALPQALSPL